MKVKFLADFFRGKNNGTVSEFVDWPAMSEPERLLVACWVNRITRHEDHEGSNKESWIINADEADLIAPDSDAYQEAQMWHYHIGNPYKDDLLEVTQWHLPKNIHGRNSAAVIHYTKRWSDIILLLGFARDHAPFPKARDPSNILRGRMHKEA